MEPLEVLTILKQQFASSAMKEYSAAAVEVQRMISVVLNAIDATIDEVNRQESLRRISEQIQALNPYSDSDK